MLNIKTHITTAEISCFEFSNLKFGISNSYLSSPETLPSPEEEIK